MIADLPHRILQDHTLSTSFTRRLILPAYDYVHLWLTVEGLNGAPTAATLDAKVQATDPIHNDGVDGEWIDVAGASIEQVTQDSPQPRSQVITLDPESLSSPYMRVVVAPSFTGGSSPAWVCSLSYVGRRR